MPQDGLPVASPEEIQAAYQTQYMAPTFPASGSPVAPMIGGGGAELPPGAVAPPGASQAPQMASVGFQPPAAPAPAVQGPATVESVVAKLTRNEPLTNEEAVIAQNMRSQTANAGGGGIAYLPTNTQQVSQTKLSPKAEAALAQYHKLGYAASDARGKAGEAEIARDQAMAEEMKRYAAEQQAENAAFDMQLQQQELRKQQLAADVVSKRDAWTKAANEEYKDPRSGVAKAVGAISAAMGAFGAAMTGSKNWALDILDNQFERDYAEWKRGIAAKRDDVTLSQQILNETSNMFKDQLAAKMAAKAMHHDAHLSQMEKASYANKDEITRAKTIAEVMAGKAQVEATLADAYGREAVTIGTGQSIAPVSTGGTGSGKERNALTDAQERATAISAQGKAFVPDIPDSYRTEQTKYKAETLQIMPFITEAQGMMDMIDQMGVGGVNLETGLSTLRQRYETLRESTGAELIKSSSGLGVTDKEFSRKMDAMFAAGKFRGDVAKEAIQTYLGQATKAVARRINSLDKRLVEDTWQQIGSELTPAQLQDLRAGRAPSRANDVKQGQALGGRPIAQ